ncbi:hypothetical protein HPB51_026055 [Rhipicephalus microplus]|uniref:Uncharacterized protein n=1 Tax=Rhipicephalus microplus TaxID=6941 RepID=A0A9J6EE73_RHIMP|nr:hypothetical protein HPB51_026055 [Rhipicephalus microplus]
MTEVRLDVLTPVLSCVFYVDSRRTGFDLRASKKLQISASVCSQCEFLVFLHSLDLRAWAVFARYCCVRSSLALLDAPPALAEFSKHGQRTRANLVTAFHRVLPPHAHVRSVAQWSGTPRPADQFLNVQCTEDCPASVHGEIASSITRPVVVSAAVPHSTVDAPASTHFNEPHGLLLVWSATVHQWLRGSAPDPRVAGWIPAEAA